MAATVRVYLSLGSNIERERHITAALDGLAAEFGDLVVSSVYESEAVGFDGENFLNLVVGIDTDRSVAELSALLKQMEADNGRRRDLPKFSARTLDLDILTYDDLTGTIDGVELPRGEILRNAFVLRPMAEIAPDTRHPLDGRSYRELWQAYERDQKLWAVSFTWQGRQVSPRPAQS
ncbi:MAG: 2-amino-4-hydroxy-6-hydroxymethyldihydropteridine diphosphokinase [Marinobacter sp.]|uniref:2-amino-4-hydroxy-6- hydroxymethyldihydropteridine diphosphokinase n=1 Tax=Marinobacter sp. TaxID=50741 RepID=UPI00299EB6B3|nr:2-amino-4-hydroxy-6-hydroxymethyldihydropteridine diphosphokinase [Marinobacter sp.]MDX1634445.1 2-amino-4-hydroxy-6-hydroxymethyldihydropteridine diphosphokinase [Marinobacter sp.]